MPGDLYGEGEIARLPHPAELLYSVYRNLTEMGPDRARVFTPAMDSERFSRETEEAVRSGCSVLALWGWCCPRVMQRSPRAVEVVW
ncbi:MAG: hypothetical protein AB1816_00630 [Bacillota bacterium]